MVSLQTSKHMRIAGTSAAYNAESLIHGRTPGLTTRSAAISIPKLPNGKLLKGLSFSKVLLKNSKRQSILEKDNIILVPAKQDINDLEDTRSRRILTEKLKVMLEAISNRIEMHQKIKDQQENWNLLLLNSINMVTLTAATMAAVSGMEGEHALPLKVCSTLLFSAITGILFIINKIQPYQMVQEQRNSARLFRQLHTKLHNTLMSRPQTLTERDVEDARESMLALDRAYPLPLSEAEFPKTLESAKWWPSNNKPSQFSSRISSQQDHSDDYVLKSKKVTRKNVSGWSQDMEEDMKEMAGLINTKEIEDYVRLGNKALKLNKALAISGPLLTGLAAIGSICGGPWGALVGAAAGSMASIVNTIEHAGQMGMVFEMYRNCGGFNRIIEEKVESNLQVEDFEDRENEELLQIKMALHLGRNLSQLRDVAAK